jgi:hypothetical protein
MKDMIRARRGTVLLLKKRATRPELSGIPESLALTRPMFGHDAADFLR